MEGLMLHCGAEPISQGQLSMMQTPAPDATHHPIPHRVLYDATVSAFESFGKYEVAESEFGVTHDGNRFFSVMSLRGDSNKKDHEIVVGLRNSHDKTFAAGMACGSRVFVCDNLCFSGDVVVNRKHTSRILDDLGGLINGAVDQLDDDLELIEMRYDHYKGWYMEDGMARDIVLYAYENGAVKKGKVVDVWEEYKNPSHDDFKDNNLWCLQQAFTEKEKGSNMRDQITRIRKLHQVFDEVSSFERPSRQVELQLDETGNVSAEIVVN